METIFIQIASYRDDELSKTIASCLSNAKFPERLSFGIVHQFDDETKHLIDDYRENTQFRIKDIPWKESRGVGVARRFCNELYENEDFTLQIDSHMRFIKDWDQLLIDEWKQCDFEKAVLSSYPPEFKYEDGKEIYIDLPPSMLIVRSFDLGYIPVFKSQEIPTKLDRPYRANFACGGFMFTIGKVCREVPYAKEICFTGEEIVHSLRLFTHGYRVFCPNLWVVYHLYDRPNSHRFWHDFNKDPELKDTSIYKGMNDISYTCVKNALLHGDSALLGTDNTLEEFQNYTGLDFKKKILHPNQLEGLEPPYSEDSDWADKIAPVKMRSIKITMDVSEFDMSLDYDFWYFGLHTEDETELIRDDIVKKVWNTDSIKIRKDYPLRELPKKYIVWPHSKTKGWLERKVFPYTTI